MRSEIGSTVGRLMLWFMWEIKKALFGEVVVGIEKARFS